VRLFYATLSHPSPVHKMQAIVLTLIQSLLIHALSIEETFDHTSNGKLRRSPGPANLPADTTVEFNSEGYGNDGVHLALTPSCSSERAGEINTGIDWPTIKTVVAFGDSVCHLT
jgi:hypothetical protein